MKMETAHLSEKLAFTNKSTRRRKPKWHNQNRHRRENLKSYNLNTVSNLSNPIHSVVIEPMRGLRPLANKRNYVTQQRFQLVTPSTFSTHAFANGIRISNLTYQLCYGDALPVLQRSTWYGVKLCSRNNFIFTSVVYRVECTVNYGPCWVKQYLFEHILILWLFNQLRGRSWITRVMFVMWIVS
jgi:hypothetical protein